jgi:membrane protein YdbS with pleckstrin-like domain
LIPSFTNNTLEITQLPQIEVLNQQSLSDKYASTNRLIFLTVILVFMLIGCVLYFQPFVELPLELKQGIPIVLGAISLLGFILATLKYAADQHKHYALRDLDLHYSSGLLFRKVVSQPITRIQHIELKRGPIDRRIGLSSLQVFSAGGEMHTFEIPGLPVDTAQQIRTYILQHKDVSQHG